MCMVGPAYPSVRMLLTAEANHNTCLGEITAETARELKGLCFIKTEVSVQAVTSTDTRTLTSFGVAGERMGCTVFIWCVLPLLFE